MIVDGRAAVVPLYSAICDIYDYLFDLHICDGLGFMMRSTGSTSKLSVLCGGRAV